MKRKKIFTMEELPDIMAPQQAADFAGISRGRIYSYCQLSVEAGGLPSFTLGKSRKIEKKALIAWLKVQGAMQLNG